MNVINESYKKSVKKLMENNPQMSLEEIRKITGLSISTITEIKRGKTRSVNNLFDAEKVALRSELKEKLINEMKQSLKKHGHLNAKGTFLERM